MALTLLDAAKQEPSMVRSGIIEEFARSSDILLNLPFQNIVGSAIQYNREDTLPGIGFRGVNEGFSESTGIINPQVERLTIAGGDLDVDNFIVTTFGTDQRTTQEMMKVKSLSLAWTAKFIKGDQSQDPRVFDGLQRRVTGTQLIANGNSQAGDPLSLNMLDALIDQVDGATHLIMNRAMRRRITQAARNTGVGGFITTEADQFGRMVTRYQDMPILIAYYDNAGAEIMPFTEANPGGGTPNSTSIYAVSIGDGKLMGIQGKAGDTFGMDVRDLGELQEKPVYRTRLEWYSGFAIFHGRAAARLWGVRDAPVVV